MRERLRIEFSLSRLLYAPSIIAVCKAAVHWTAALHVNDQFAAFSIVSRKIPYPLVGSFSSTWVTAPTNLPFCKMGEPDMSDVNKGQKLF